MTINDNKDALNAEQIEQLNRLREYFPYRIIWGCTDPFGGNFQCHASPDRRLLNKRLRDGWSVFLIT